MVKNRLLDMIQERYPTYHPLMALADIAHSEEADINQRITCNKTIAEYIEPKLKQIDVRGTLEQPKVLVTLFDDEVHVLEDKSKANTVNNMVVDRLLEEVTVDEWVEDDTYI